jgi:hypothetical protein
MNAIRWGAIILRVAVIPGVACLLAFLTGLACQLFGDRAPDSIGKVCFPLSQPEDVIVDEQGRIYVALTFYGRVQVYNRDGAFLYGFFAKAWGGPLRLHFDADGRLNVVSKYGHLHVYDDAGRLLATKDDVEGRLYKQLVHERPRGFRDSNGSSYMIHGAFLNPRVLRRDKHGNITLRIRTPTVMWPLIGPFPCWLMLGAFAVCGMVRDCSRFWKQNHRQVGRCADLFPGGRIRRRDVLLWHPSRRCDVLLSDRGVCWAPTVWEPYTCIAYPDLSFRIEYTGLFKSKKVLYLQSVSEPELSIQFSPYNCDEWVSHIEHFRSLSDCANASAADGESSGSVALDTGKHNVALAGPTRKRKRDLKSFRPKTEGRDRERGAAIGVSVFIMACCLFSFLLTWIMFPGGPWIAKLIVQEIVFGVFFVAFFTFLWGAFQFRWTEASIQWAVKRLSHLAVALLILAAFFVPLALIAAMRAMK